MGASARWWLDTVALLLVLLGGASSGTPCEPAQAHLRLSVAGAVGGIPRSGRLLQPVRWSSQPFRTW